MILTHKHCLSVLYAGDALMPVDLTIKLNQLYTCWAFAVLYFIASEKKTQSLAQEF